MTCWRMVKTRRKVSKVVVLAKLCNDIIDHMTTILIETFTIQTPYRFLDLY